MKTLSDAASASVNYAPVATTVIALRALPAAAVGASTPRVSGAETTTYTIQVRLVSMKLEDDKDIHLVVADAASGQTMIVEFPNPTCQGAITSAHVTHMAAARAALISAEGIPGSSFMTLSGTATISGVGFFDVIHGQTGVAPNGIELHPALAFSAATALPPLAPTTTAVPSLTTTTVSAPPTAHRNIPPRIATVSFGDAAHGIGRSYAITETVRFKACDDTGGTLVAELSESKSVGEQLLATARHIKALKLVKGCAAASFKWRLARRFFGVGAYVISLRVRDSHGAWSGARTHRVFTSD